MIEYADSIQRNKTSDECPEYDCKLHLEVKVQICSWGSVE